MSSDPLPLSPDDPAAVEPAGPRETPEALEGLRSLLGELATTLVRYTVETSGAELRDAFDRKAFALYEEWLLREAALREAVVHLLESEGEFGGAGRWPLVFSQFNYLSAAYLLRHVIRFTERLVERLSALRAGLEPSPRGRDLLAQAIRLEESFLERARALEAERPKAEPKTAELKGTSAARW